MALPVSLCSTWLSGERTPPDKVATPTSIRFDISARLEQKSRAPFLAQDSGPTLKLDWPLSRLRTLEIRQAVVAVSGHPDGFVRGRFKGS